MKTVTIRDFRTRPNAVRRAIAGEPQSLLTASGKPFALLVPVDSDSLDETVEALKIGRAQTALRGLREEARRRGLDTVSPADVEAVIAKARKARRARGSRAAR
ncbi:MAG: hypothetical protein GEV06_23490 [Luteitalea sp.]|nr:hypothetical protein [Luteitalea sp.]